MIVRRLGLFFLWQLIVQFLRKEEIGSYGEARAAHLVPNTVGHTTTTHTNRPGVGRYSVIACANGKAVGGNPSQGHHTPLGKKSIRDGRRSAATMMFRSDSLKGVHNVILVLN